MTKYLPLVLSILFLLAPCLTLAGDDTSKYPFEMTWSDHRPINSLWIGDSHNHTAQNPRGWFSSSKKIDVTTEAGRADLREKLMKYADNAIAISKEMDAQGVIVWDIEGQEMTHPTSYIADPRMLAQVAPEMEPLADAFFKKFKSAGLRVGVSIRPTRVTGTEHQWTQTEVPDYISEMNDKINYAQKRWGCTLFYIDSNVTYFWDAQHQLHNPTMPVEGFIKLAHMHKDCLLIPEHSTPAYWAATAPYYELRPPHNHTSTPADVRAIYPHAFTVLRVVDGPPLEGDVFDKLVAAVKGGDILLFRGWFADPANARIKAIYDAAKH